MLPGVDVIIPVRNGAATITRAVESVLRQTHLPGRILVVDDGSTDGSADLVRGLRGVEILTTRPVGASHARNTGLRASRAEFVAFLDCDDFWLPDKLSQQLRTLTRHPQAVACNTAFMSVDTKGREVEGAAQPVALRGDVHARLLKLFPRGGGGSSTMMARRGSLLDVGGFDERLAFGEDRDMWLRLARGREFEYCPAVLACIVDNPASVTRRALEDPKMRIEMLLQNLTITDKWIGVTGLPAGLFATTRSEILILALRNRMGYADVIALKQDLMRRAPKLAARIAPNDATFIAGLLLGGLVTIGTTGRRFVRYRRRLKARRRGPRSGLTHS